MRPVHTMLFVTEDVKKTISMHLLLVRFAWTIFPFLHMFLQSNPKFLLRLRKEKWNREHDRLDILNHHGSWSPIQSGGCRTPTATFNLQCPIRPNKGKRDSDTEMEAWSLANRICDP